MGYSQIQSRQHATPLGLKHVCTQHLLLHLSESCTQCCVALMSPLGCCQQQTQLDTTHSTAGCRRPQRRMRQQTRHTKRSETDATKRFHGHTQHACEAFRNTQTEPCRPNANQAPAAATWCATQCCSTRARGYSMALKDSTDAAVLWTTKCDVPPPPIVHKLSFLLLQMCVDTCVHVCV